MADENPPVTPPPPPPDTSTWRTRLAELFAKSFVRQVLLVLGLLFVIYFISVYSRDFGERKATEWLNLYNATDVKANTPIVADTQPTPAANANDKSNAGTPRPTTTANANSNTQTTTTQNVNANTNTNPETLSGANTAAEGTKAEGKEQTTATPATSPATIITEIDM